MQEILGAARRCIHDYNMISTGDRITVGVSGGKDSMVLLEAMYWLREFIDIPFEIHAIVVDPQFGGKPTDYTLLEDYCKAKEIPITIHRSYLGELVFDVRKEKNPCSLCAKMRRGILHNMTNELGFNKIALGHHLDDVAETFLLNLLQGGRLGCFSPVTYLSRKDITMIRPLIYLEEKDIKKACEKAGLPVVKNPCPVDGATTRQETKELILQLQRQGYQDVKTKIKGALVRAEIDDWGLTE